MKTLFPNNIFPILFSIISSTTVAQKTIPEKGRTYFGAGMRFSPFKNFVGGGDVGYAFGLNNGNEGGLYLSPRATYIINGKFPVFLGYRTTALEGGNLNGILFGIGYVF